MWHIFSFFYNTGVEAAYRTTPGESCVSESQGNAQINDKQWSESMRDSSNTAVTKHHISSLLLKTAMLHTYTGGLNQYTATTSGTDYAYTHYVHCAKDSDCHAIRYISNHMLLLVGRCCTVTSNCCCRCSKETTSFWCMILKHESRQRATIIAQQLLPAHQVMVVGMFEDVSAHNLATFVGFLSLTSPQITIISR